MVSCLRLTGLLFVTSPVMLAVLVALGRSAFKPVPYKDACDNHHERSRKTPTLPGLPYECGWHALRPGTSGSRAYAFIQPRGTFCWSNTGLILPPENSKLGSVLIDTLTEPTLTRNMILDRPEARCPGGEHLLQGVIYTHPDVDHILGDQVVAHSVPRYGRAAINDELKTLKGTKPKLVIASLLGHALWSILETSGWRGWVSMVPNERARDVLLIVAGWGWMQSQLSGFRFEEVEVSLMKGVDNVIDKDEETVKVNGVSDIVVRYYGAIHSKSDSMVYLPSEKVVYTGDLLFIGIAPVMWAGPAQKWVAALGDLIDRTGEDWLFVPGHGPVTDLQGVRLVKSYFEYVDRAVTQMCSPTDTSKDLDCAYKVLEGLPEELRVSFDEPQRILINAQVECLARRKGGSIQVELPTKVKLLAAQGEYAVREMLGLVKHAP